MLKKLLFTIIIFGASAFGQIINPGGGGGAGSVTQVNTTSPITGGPITGTGTLACATCATGGTFTANNFLAGGGGQVVKLADANGTVYAMGSISTDVNPFALTWTTNNAATTFSGFKLAVTNTAQHSGTFNYQFCGGAAGATCATLDTAANFSTPGTGTFGAGNSVAGEVSIGGGTAATALANAWNETWAGGAADTAVKIIHPLLPTTGLAHWAFSAGVITETGGAVVTGDITSLQLDKITGSTAQATLTETAISHEVTFAGVETAALTYPIVFQNTNATNTTSGALAINTVGAGTAQVPVTINQPATDVGNIIQGINGGTFTNGVESGGTVNWAVTSTGMGLFGASAPNLTLGTSGGSVATEGTAFTGTSTQYGWYNDSTLHCLDIIDQTTNIGCAVGEVSILAANVLTKAVGTTSKIVASSISDSGTSVSTTENTIVGTAGGIPNVDKTIGYSPSAMSGQTTATCTNITNMTWTIAASKNYKMSCEIPVTLAATATIQFCLNGPGSPTHTTLDAWGPIGAAGVYFDGESIGTTSWGGKTTASGAAANTSVVHVTAEIQNGATASGTALTLQTAANGTNAITVLADAACSLTQVN